MSENTMTTEKQSPHKQKIKWKNVAYYGTFNEANSHRLSFEEGTIVKVRRCGPDKTKFVVKVGTRLEESSSE